jgi:hypothetical protein
MGWQDAPEIGQPQSKWMSAPTVEPESRFMENALQTIGQGASGFNKAILSGMGGLIDLPLHAGKAVGLPVEPFASEALAELLPKMPDPISTGEKLARGVGTGVGEAASFLVPGGAMAKAGKVGGMVRGVGQKMVEQPLAQSLVGALGGGVTEVTDSPLAGMLASMLAPIGFGGVRSLVTPIQRQLSPEQARLITSAKSQGVPVTPGQEMGSDVLKTAESTLAQLPFSSKPQLAIYDAQKKALNKIALKKAGIDSEFADPATLDKAYKDIGIEYNELVDRTTLNVDPQFFDEIESVANQYGRRLGSDKKAKFQSRFDDLMEMAQYVDRDQPAASLQQMLTGARGAAVSKTQIDGSTYKKIATDLREVVRGETDTDTKKALQELQKSFDGLMERSTANQPETASKWRDVRNRYRNLLTVDKAMQGGTAEARASGVLTPSGMKTAVAGMDRPGYARGRGDLNEISRMMGALAPTIPDSGTARRNLMNRLLTLGAAGGAGGVAAVDPVLAGVTLAGGLALPPMIQKLINSPAGRAYLTNQLDQLPRGPQRQAIQNALMAQGFGDINNNPGNSKEY